MQGGDVRELVRAYYRWDGHQQLRSLCYSHRDTVARLRGSIVGAAGMSDDDAIIVNEALCALKREDGDAFAIVELVCRPQREPTLRELEARGCGDRRTLSARLDRGLYFVKGRVFV